MQFRRRPVVSAIFGSFGPASTTSPSAIVAHSFPKAHWKHPRITHPVESLFAAFRLGLGRPSATSRSSAPPVGPRTLWRNFPPRLRRFSTMVWISRSNPWNGSPPTFESLDAERCKPGDIPAPLGTSTLPPREGTTSFKL